MVFRRGIGRDAVLSADIQMLGGGVSLVGKDVHTFHAQKFFRVQCHGRERMGIVHATGIVVHEELVLCIAACLHIVAHVDDVAVQDYRSGVRVGKADLGLAAFLQPFFYAAVPLFFGFLVGNLCLDFLRVNIPIPLIELVLVLLDLVIEDRKSV